MLATRPMIEKTVTMVEYWKVQMQTMHNGPQSAKKVQKVNVSDFEFFDVFGSIEVYWTQKGEKSETELLQI